MNYHFNQDLSNQAIASKRYYPNESRVVPSKYCMSGPKRVFDVFFGVLALLVLSPFLLFVAAMVKITSPGPIFFGHVRIGRDGKSFKCWKFRTMVQDAQQRLDKLLQDPTIAEEWNRSHKLMKDPRVTPIGNILRRLSLDELPQIWNIIVGDMSIVGPRPVTSAELLRYGLQVGYYLYGRPGLTGPWQVGGRSSTSYDERVVLDKNYVKSASALGDIILIIRTVGVLFGDRDAA